MTTLLLAAALVLFAAVMIWREIAFRAEREKHRLVVADLLDRVMARSYGEYVASHPATPGRPLRRRVLTDAEMAALEQKTMAERGK